MERLALYAALVGCAWVVQRIWKCLYLPHHVGEPPLLSPSTPWVGHVVGMLRHGSYYYSIVSKKTTAPIFTLRVPGAKIYVVKSPRLASQVDRIPRDISSAPYVMMFVERILASSKEGLKTLSVNLYDDARWGCMAESRKVMHDALSPAQDLGIVAHSMATHLWPHVSSLEKIPNGGRIHLHRWLKHVICRASSDAVWGPKNPFHDPKFVDGFWTFLEQFAFLGLDFLPNFFAPKGHQGRETVFEGFRKYYAAKGHHDASPLVQKRFEVNKKFGIAMDDIAKYDVTVATPLLINSAVAAFWCCYELYSHPELLSEMRDGLRATARTSPSDNFLHMDVDQVSAKFPKWEAFVREVLRLKAYNLSARAVLRDTTLEGGYLLKKDSILLIPSAEIHSDPEMWGTAAEEFRPERFLKEGGIRSGVPASSYRTFGAGPTLCPGRHLFMTEMIVLMAIMVLKYDIQPVGGVWGEIERQAHMLKAILAPARDIEVDMVERDCDEKNRWKFYWAGTELDSALPVSRPMPSAEKN